MKQNLRCVFFLLSFLFLSVFQVFAEKIGNIEYTLNSGMTATVTALTSGKYTGDITVPSMVTSTDGNTYTVTAIGEKAFYQCTSLTKVILPNTITSIGENAFSGSKLMSEVTICDGVTSIGDYAFKACDNLRSIDLPNSVKSIGEGTFANCVSLTSATLSNILTSIPQSLFVGCTKLTSITIPTSVTSISPLAFFGCSMLETIDIPNSVDNIGINAFSDTKWLNNQPDGVVYAGKVAYKYKGTMPTNTKVILKDGTVGVGDEAFENCSNLKSITLPSTMEYVGQWAFHNCTGLESIIMYDVTPPIIYTQTIGSTKAKPYLYVINPEAYKASSYYEKYFEDVTIKEIFYDVSVSSAGYATFSAPVPTIIPSGVKAYKAVLHEVNESDNDLGTITFERIYGTIPACCGVLLKGNQGSYTFNLSKETVTVDNNMLSETGYDVVNAGENDYVLAVFDNDEGKSVVGFYIANNDLEIPVNKAYFHLSNTNGVKGFMFNFAEPTNINAPINVNTSNTYFNLNGKREFNPKNGNLYIVNGKITTKN